MGRKQGIEKKPQTFNVDIRINDFLERMGSDFNKSEWASEILMREVEASQLEQKVRKAQEIDLEMQEKAKEKEKLLFEVERQMEEKKADFNEKEKKALESAEYKLIYAKIDNYRQENREIVNQSYLELKEKGILSPGEKTIWQLNKWKDLIETKMAGSRPEIG